MMTSTVALRMEDMWRGLPEEILVSNVLPHLPMASLCRFRAVCKNWNSLPTQSNFVTQHALASPVEGEFVLITFAKEFILITLRSMQPTNSLRDCWNVLDVANDSIPARSKKLLAADGGLLLVFLFGDGNGRSLIVCNPILKIVKVIPSPLDTWFHYCIDVVMFTDTVSMEYMILMFHPMEYHYQTKYMDVFESKTGRWRRVVNTSVRASPGRWYKRSKFVKFKNALYQLCNGSKNDEDEKPYLMEFDKSTGVGSILDFPEFFLGHMDCARAHTFELVVSLGRLFCVYRPWRKENRNTEHDDDCLEVFEIFLERHEWESLVRMPKALLHWLDGNDFNSYADLEKGLIPFLPYQRDIVDPIGCASSILFCSGVVGRFVAYDLASKSWHQFSHSCPPHLYKQPSLFIPRTNFGPSLCPP